MILKLSIIIILVTSSLSVCKEVYDEALVELRDGNSIQVFFKHPIPYVPNDTPYAVSGYYQGEKIFLYVITLSKRERNSRFVKLLS